MPIEKTMILKQLNPEKMLVEHDFSRGPYNGGFREPSMQSGGLNSWSMLAGTTSRIASQHFVKLH